MSNLPFIKRVYVPGTKRRALHILSHLILPTRQGGEHCLLKRRKERERKWRPPGLGGNVNAGLLTTGRGPAGAAGPVALRVSPPRGQRCLARQPSEQERTPSQASPWLGFGGQLSREGGQLRAAPLLSTPSGARGTQACVGEKVTSPGGPDLGQRGLASPPREGFPPTPNTPPS